MEIMMNSVIEEKHFMLQLELQSAEFKKTRRISHPAIRIDMTPMVDLGFLLITFFIFTTTISNKTIMKLYMPHDGVPTLVGDSKVLTVLLGDNNRVYAYEGSFENALHEHTIIPTNFNESEGVGY